MDSTLHPLPANELLTVISVQSTFTTNMWQYWPLLPSESLLLPLTLVTSHSTAFSSHHLGCFFYGYHRWILKWEDPWTLPIQCSEFSLHAYVQLSREGFHRFIRNHLTHLEKEKEKHETVTYWQPSEEGASDKREWFTKSTAANRSS